MDEVIVLVKSRTYMLVRDMASWYGHSPQTIRRNVQIMRESGRYNNKFLVLDSEGKQLINSLAYEDFLAHKVELKNRNLARRLAPYDPAEIRRQRGEYKYEIG